MNNPNTPDTQPTVAPAKVLPVSGSPVQPRTAEPGNHQPKTEPLAVPTPKI